MLQHNDDMNNNDDEGEAQKDNGNGDDYLLSYTGVLLNLTNMATN